MHACEHTHKQTIIYKTPHKNVEYMLTNPIFV